MTVSKYSINILGEFNLAGEAWIIRKYYEKMGIEVVSTLTSKFQKYAMKEKGVIDVHLGGNYIWKINDWLKLDFRGGGYFEPSRVERVENRLHYTGGI